MDKYEKAFSDILGEFDEKGFWFKNEFVKVGFSYAEVFLDTDDGAINIECDCESALNEMIYNTWEEFFEHFKDLKFVFTLDCAISGNFVTWNDFKDIIDGKLKKHIVTL